MSIDNLEKYINTAQEALRSFLATLLGAEALLNVGSASQVGLDRADQRGMKDIAFMARSNEDHWAVVLDSTWLPLLSKSMLGEPIHTDDPGAEDLLKELAAQAYGSVRTQLASAGVVLPDVDIELMGDGERFGGHRFSAVLYEIPFQITIEDETLTGFAIVPPVGEEMSPRVRNSGAEFDEEDGPLDIALDPVAGPTGAATSKSPAGSASTVRVQPASFPDLGSEMIGADGSNKGFELLAEVELEVTVELGRRSIPLADVLRLTTGSVIELEKLVGEPLEVYANGRLIAEGEAVVMDEQFGIRITNLISGKARAKAFV